MLSLIIGGCGAKQKDEVHKSYDLAAPDKFNMPESLFEISGIALEKGNPDTIYAVQDEDGRVLRLGWDNPRQHSTKFAKKGDYEDISILRDKVVVLKSNGFLYTFALAEAIYEEPEQVREYKKILPKGEYEGMYGDEASGKLYVICKKCTEDDSKHNVTGYVFELDKDSTAATEKFSIDVDQIKALNGKVSRGFRPSGLAKHPLTKDWYIISAVNKLMVVTDAKWKVKEAYTLSGNTFIQPEGLAFDTAGNLYISDEGDDLFSGNIMKFKYKGQ